MAAMEEETAAYESSMAQTPGHTFSKRFEKRKRQIIRLADQRLTGSVHELQRRAVRRVRIRTLLVAALILLLAVSTVVAIVKPEIYYIIKEKITNWEISFGMSPEEETTDTVDFEVVRPVIPEGFSVVEEDEGADVYFLTIQNNKNKDIDISYSQMLPEGTNVQLDSERNTNAIEIIAGTEAIVAREDGATNILFNNGKYVFLIGGNCDESILREMAEEILDRN